MIYFEKCIKDIGHLSDMDVSYKMVVSDFIGKTYGLEKGICLSAVCNTSTV